MLFFLKTCKECISEKLFFKKQYDMCLVNVIFR